MVRQDVVWIIALVGMAVVALGFVYVIMQAGRPAENGAGQKGERALALRRWLFGALLMLFVGVSYATLWQFPIPPQNTDLGIDQVVDVSARQWVWQIEPSSVQAGSPVEFRVTSQDVNHSFALYGPDGRIVTQTQAMPGFTNKLVHTFTEPGVYRVLCLEYCGVAHAAMATQLTVVAAGEE